MERVHRYPCLHWNSGPQHLNSDTIPIFQRLFDIPTDRTPQKSEPSPSSAIESLVGAECLLWPFTFHDLGVSIPQV